MPTYATDTDLLHWEPNLFRDASAAAQTLLAGTGATLDGTTLTISGASFTDANVHPQNVIVLGGSITGSFPIVTVPTATTLTLSVLYDKLFADSADDAEDVQPASSPGDGSSLTFTVRTF